MIRLSNIHPLSDFQRNTKSHLRKLKKTGEPMVLTINGEAKLVVLDAGAYQKMLEEIEEARLRVSVEESERGEVVGVKEAFSQVRRQASRRRKR
jgi:PHD/YefM family antitoxin component YafN of YafNO toxin-antitoxin module